MKCEDCLRLLEGFVEKELDARSSEGVEAHLALCPACARAYSEQAQEQEIYSSYVLDVQASPALWAGLRAAIREENAARAGSPLQKMRHWLALPPGPLPVPRAFGGALPYFAASLLLVAAFIYAQRPAPRDAGPAPASVADAAPAPAPAAEVARRVTEGAAPTLTGATEADGAPEQTRPARERRATYVPAYVPAPRRHASPARGGAAPPRPETSVAARAPSGEPAYLVAGEQAYRKPIAELAGQIEARGAEALPPALRAEYSRELAAVERAIAAIREDARRHPDDPNLAEFMRAAYKGKLELLASVAEQGEAADSDRR